MIEPSDVPGKGPNDYQIYEREVRPPSFNGSQEGPKAEKP